MPRTKEQFQAMKDARKKRLLDIALESFSVKGYKEVSTDTITKAARCSHGLFYHYFSNKEGVYRAVIREYVASGTFLDFEALKEKNGQDGIRAIADAFANAFKEKGNAIHAARVLLFTPEDKGHEILESSVARLIDLKPYLVRYIREGQLVGDVIAGDPEEIALTFLDTLRGASNRKIEKPKGPKPPSSDVLVELLLKRPL